MPARRARLTHRQKLLPHSAGGAHDAHVRPVLGQLRRHRQARAPAGRPARRGDAQPRAAAGVALPQPRRRPAARSGRLHCAQESGADCVSLCDPPVLPPSGAPQPLRRPRYSPGAKPAAAAAFAASIAWHCAASLAGEGTRGSVTASRGSPLASHSRRHARRSAAWAGGGARPAAAAACALRNWQSGVRRAQRGFRRSGGTHSEADEQGEGAARLLERVAGTEAQERARSRLLKACE